jgi:excisionase family DNA binding protein
MLTLNLGVSRVSKSYMPINEFAAEFGISRMTVYRLLGAKTLRAVKIGKRTLVDRGHAAQWFEKLPSADIKKAA